MITLRAPNPGDLGWIVQRHGALYAAEQGWDARFEGVVAGVVSDFVKTFDPARQACWIAEHEGAPVGSVMLVKEDETIARLRVLLVEPSARGLGVGEALVDACLAFARTAGYAEIVLWTQSNLLGARRLYERAGFVLEKAWPYDGFGEGLISEAWRLKL